MYVLVQKYAFLCTCVMIGGLVAFTCGITYAWSSPINAKLTLENITEDNPFGRRVTETEESWIGSLLALGAIFGPILSSFTMDRFGRKKTLLLVSGAPQLASFLILAFSRKVYLYYVARLLAGFSLGAVFAVLPNFNCEISQDSTRGLIASSMTTFVVLGPVFVSAVGPYVPIMWFNLICAIFPALFIVLFLTIVPESPYYLVSIENYKSATESLKKLRSSDDVKDELEKIQQDVQMRSQNGEGSFVRIFKEKALVKATIISLALVTFQQMGGIAAVLFNTQRIFVEASTSSTISSEMASLIVGVAQLAGSVAAPFFVDRLGRRLLLLMSGVGMLVTDVLLGLYFYLKDNGHDVESIFWQPIVSLVVFTNMYNLGFGPLPWVVMAEVFPPDVKVLASTATSSFCWLLGFLVTRFFSPLSASIGMAGSFWLFSAFCALSVIFLSTFMIETKGKSFQEIQAILAK